MKTKILSLAFVMAFLVSAIGYAQKPLNAEGQPRDKSERVEMMKKKQMMQKRQAEHKSMFTTEQKESMKNIKMATMKKMKPLQDQLRELSAKQRTLTTAEKPDIAAIDKNIEKMGQVKTEMAKIKEHSNQEFRALLTEEQKMMMDLRKSQGARMDAHRAKGHKPQNAKGEVRRG